MFGTESSSPPVPAEASPFHDTPPLPDTVADMAIRIADSLGNSETKVPNVCVVYPRFYGIADE
jgi:hypothetical protein